MKSQVLLLCSLATLSIGCASPDGLNAELRAVFGGTRADGALDALACSMSGDAFTCSDGEGPIFALEYDGDHAQLVVSDDLDRADSVRWESDQRVVYSGPCSTDAFAFIRAVSAALDRGSLVEAQATLLTRFVELRRCEVRTIRNPVRARLVGEEGRYDVLEIEVDWESVPENAIFDFTINQADAPRSNPCINVRVSTELFPSGSGRPVTGLIVTPKDNETTVDAYALRGVERLCIENRVTRFRMRVEEAALLNPHRRIAVDLLEGFHSAVFLDGTWRRMANLRQP